MQIRSMTGAVVTAVAAAALGGGALASAASAPPASASAACPQRSPAVPTRQGWGPARHALAPSAATWVRVCRYSGLNDRPPSHLTAGAVIRDRAEVGRIVRRLSRLPAGLSGPVSCPADDGSQIALLLSYRNEHVVAISLGLTGCGIVTNGAVHRTDTGARTDPGPVLLRELEADARGASR